mgnify:CR=1 FL=1
MADNNTILEKLEGLVARFEEVSTLITDPAVIADQKRYVKLTKEYKELGDLMNARKEYMQVLNGIEEAKEIIANETDAEMREMAREELDACQARQPELEEEIKLLLVPADPQDSRNAILEIRGGVDDPLDYRGVFRRDVQPALGQLPGNNFHAGAFNIGGQVVLRHHWSFPLSAGCARPIAAYTAARSRLWRTPSASRSSCWVRYSCMEIGAAAAGSIPLRRQR